MKKKAEAFHAQLVESIAENDDEMLHKFLEGEEISADELRASLRKSTIALKVFPVVVGTSFKNKGVQPLLDAVVDYLPSPLDVPETHGKNPDNGEADHPQGGRQRAVLGVGVQDHGGSVCRTVDFYPRVLRAS